MSTATDQSGDTFLARRFNFLGFPGERDKTRGAMPYTSYADLRAELGDDNAAALVSKVGVLVQKRGLEALGVPLPHAVDRIVQSLTADERRTMAEGGTVPRVESLISAEVSQAEAQQKLARANADDIKAAAIGQYAALGLLGGRKGDIAGKADNGNAGNGRELSSYERQQAEQVSKALAVAEKYGLGWVANNPELLRLGPSAIKALADVHLENESYERFKRGGLSDKGIVGGARYFRRTGGDFNEYSKSYEETKKSLPAADQDAHARAVDGYFKAVGGEKPPTPVEEEAAKKEFNKKMDEIGERNPAARKHIEHEKEQLRTQKKEEKAVKAKASADTSANDDLLASINSSSPAPANKVSDAKPASATHTAAAEAPATGKKDDAAKPKPQQTASVAAKPKGMSV
ncbi:hypothetical protein [Bradyrhizobium acaciae]|uniref:hypothetical protein n=1 Tax=Bradyrhizobium acaciae TaxID=2683706 RepID=UPI001E3072F3|nr:hypothetical protein [Bradyrhizobium acaciae]MCC8978900.1 hypothetical protein [Bradyrhizobium acaciae]